AMQEHRDGGDRMVLIAGDEIGAGVLLADVEFGFAREPPMSLTRAHIGQKDELEAGGLDQPFLERAENVVLAGGEGHSRLGDGLFLVLCVGPVIQRCDASLRIRGVSKDDRPRPLDARARKSAIAGLRIKTLPDFRVYPKSGAWAPQGDDVEGVSDPMNITLNP